MPSSTPPAIDQDWFEESFDELYPVIYAHRTVEAAAPESEFAAHVLDLHGDHHVLDLACGNGRHLVHLARRTPHAIGLDFSPDLLSIAREQLARAARLVRGDMRALPFVAAFDFITNFFTSFGYFITEEENCAVVSGMARALKPDGQFLIDYFNAELVESTLVPESQRAAGGYHISERRWIDHATSRVNKETFVHHAGTLAAKYHESVRMYTAEEFTALLGGCGLQVDQYYGDYQGGALTADAPRMIAIGRRAH